MFSYPPPEYLATEILHCKFPHVLVVTVLCDRAVTVLSSTSGKLQNHASVPP